MKKLTGLTLFLIVVLWSSCRSDFEATETNGQLKFSRDTIFLDTVFSGLSTATYSFKVYNRSREDIFIPEISLEWGANSLYRLNINGVAGKNFEEVEILARDSIYIFIETTVPPEALTTNEFLYIDKIQFRSRAHLQEVPLVTLVKDAILLYPKKDDKGVPEKIAFGTNELGEPQFISGFNLPPAHLSFTRTKPYVIYGYAAVPEGKTLVIEAGARIYFHADSGLIIREGATLKVKGKPDPDPEKIENQVVFQGDRLQSLYKKIPGQWGTIWLQKGSRNHVFENAIIRNATVGILAESDLNTPTPLDLKNIQIYNSAVSGIRAEGIDLHADNLVINNSGQASLHLTGGNSRFSHASIGNYWQQSFRLAPAVYITNKTEAAPVPLQVRFFNSIIYGNEKKELELDIDPTFPAEVVFSHNLIRFSGESPAGEYYDFGNIEIYNNVWLNEDPLFAAPRENDLRLEQNSAAIDKGDPDIAEQLPKDIRGTNRISNPDLGAYEAVE